MRALFRIATTTLLVAASAMPAAQEAVECTGIADDSARLACYDALFDVIAPDNGDPLAAFGREQIDPQPRDNRASSLDQMTAAVSTISKPKGRAAVITLDNEQVWSQVSFRYVRLREGDSVTIKPSRFGGYILTNERGVTMRVRRIR